MAGYAEALASLRALHERPDDHACCVAPRFYGVAAFEPIIEGAMLEAGLRLA